jgi:tryptophanyl-tRNA synthetase
LHIGHYFSVIKPGQAGADVLIANYHAPEEQDTEKIIDLLHKFGVQKVNLQREIFNPELYFQLLTIASIGDLERMTQYKSTKDEDKTAQLLTYPVLMTHDVAGYKEVLVGEDQKQHLEYARRLLKRYNRKFGKDYLIPKENIVGGRIRDLKVPENKMSKSSPDGCLFLDDTKDVIAQKVRRATMDELGRENMVFLYNEFVGGEVPESNSSLKERLTESIANRICITL